MNKLRDSMSENNDSSGEIGAVNLLTLDFIYSGLPKIPSLGEEVSTNQFILSFGGGPVATLVTAARLGAETRLATSLGEDHISTIARSFLDSEPIRYKSFFKAASRTPVNITSVMTFANQDRAFVSYFPENDFCETFIEEIYEYLKNVSFCLASVPYNTLFRKLKQAGCRIIYDVGWSDDLNLNSLKGTLENVYLFAPNEKEALKLTGAGSADEALKILSEYVSIPIIKQGEKGALVWHQGHPVTVPALDFVQVDSTGAGDVFLGGVIYGLLQGWDILRAVELGNYTGGKSTTALGCVTARCTLEEFLAMGRKT
jgi:sugar/nucleoside kinase (ribokinase family)